MSAKAILSECMTPAQACGHGVARDVTGSSPTSCWSRCTSSFGAMFPSEGLLFCAAFQLVSYPLNCRTFILGLLNGSDT